MPVQSYCTLFPVDVCCRLPSSSTSYAMLILGDSTSRPLNNSNVPNCSRWALALTAVSAHGIPLSSAAWMTFFSSRGPSYLSSNHSLSPTSGLIWIYVFLMLAPNQTRITTAPSGPLHLSPNWLPELFLFLLQFNLLPDTRFIVSKPPPLFYIFSKAWFFSIP